MLTAEEVVAFPFIWGRREVEKNQGLQLEEGRVEYVSTWDPPSASQGASLSMSGSEA